jgi:AcrR family transcriptional regulator
VDDRRRIILDQALALVDEQGLAAVSMRAVAERVGLTSMALYPYVGGKDALLDGLVELLERELGDRFADDPADWRHRLRCLGRAVRELAHAHPGAFPLLLTRPGAAAGGTGPAGTSWLSAALRSALHAAGVPATAVPRLARLWIAFLVGYTTAEVTGALPDGPPDPDAEFEADLDDLVAVVAAAVSDRLPARPR